MKRQRSALLRAFVVGGAAAVVFLLSGCGGDKQASENAAAPATVNGTVAATAPVAGNGDAPDTSAMGPYILSKINANPAIEGKATLVELKQKSVSAHPLGDKIEIGRRRIRRRRDIQQRCVLELAGPDQGRRAAKVRSTRRVHGPGHRLAARRAARDLPALVRITL
jgi:hypothetical protein